MEMHFVIPVNSPGIHSIEQELKSLFESAMYSNMEPLFFEQFNFRLEEIFQKYGLGDIQTIVSPNYENSTLTIGGIRPIDQCALTYLFTQVKNLDKKV